MGIAGSVATLTVFRALTKDPYPHESERMVVPMLDVGDLNPGFVTREPDDQLTYTDAVNLLNQHQAFRQTALYGVAAVVESPRASGTPTSESGLAPTNTFFSMFELTFAEGSAWSDEDDKTAAFRVVLSKPFAEKLFGNDKAVGQAIRLDDQQYTVVGVLNEYTVVPKPFRAQGRSSRLETIEPFLVPFSNAIAREWRNNGNTNCSGPSPRDSSFAAFLNQTCTFIQYWAELKSVAEKSDFEQSLKGYVESQKKLGRMPRPMNNRLLNMTQWRQLQDDNADTKLASILAVGFLLLCLVNATGMLIAKYSARSGEIGVRRALGALQADIVWQFIVESAVVGFVGGVLGLVLGAGLLFFIRSQIEDMAPVAKLDSFSLFVATLLSFAACLLAGGFPSWRASVVRPALQLKMQ